MLSQPPVGSFHRSLSSPPQTSPLFRGGVRDPLGPVDTHPCWDEPVLYRATAAGLEGKQKEDKSYQELQSPTMWGPLVLHESRTSGQTSVRNQLFMSKCWTSLSPPTTSDCSTSGPQLLYLYICEDMFGQTPSEVRQTTQRLGIVIPAHNRSVFILDHHSAPKPEQILVPTPALGRLTSGESTECRGKRQRARRRWRERGDGDG